MPSKPLTFSTPSQNRKNPRNPLPRQKAPPNHKVPPMPTDKTITPQHLQTIRTALGITPDAAGKILATAPTQPQGVSARTWRAWEQAEKPIPPDVQATCRRLAAYWRASIAAQKSAARIQPSPEPWAALVQKSVDACADMAKIPSP